MKNKLGLCSNEELATGIAFGAYDEIDLACLSVHFPVAEAYEGINPEVDFSSGEENDTFPGP